jgi:hypothetical protein
MARLTWVLAVAGLMTSRSAISWLGRPSPTRATTSRSRSVRLWSSPPGRGSFVLAANCAISRLAVAGLADHLDVGLGVQQRAKARPHQRLVVGEQDPDHRAPAKGRRARTPNPPTRPGSGVQVPAQCGCPFAHAHDLLAASRPIGHRTATAIVVDLDGELASIVGDAHGCGGGAGVAGDVGQGLLHDPECRCVHTKRQPPRVTVGLGVDLESRGRRLREQLVQPGERGGGIGALARPPAGGYRAPSGAR